jgi:hypothetical protein
MYQLYDLGLQFFRTKSTCRLFDIKKIYKEINIKKYLYLIVIKIINYLIISILYTNLQ